MATAARPAGQVTSGEAQEIPVKREFDAAPGYGELGWIEGRVNWKVTPGPSFDEAHTCPP